VAQHHDGPGRWKLEQKIEMTKKKSSEESNDRIFRAVRGEFYESIAGVLRTARSNAYRAVNFVMVEAYWNIGRMIVEEEQQGKERAEYGAALIKNLSLRLTEEFGKGLTERNLLYMRQFYLAFPSEGPQSQKLNTVCSQLTWSHYRLLMRLEKPEARQWYMTEAASQI